MLHTIYALIDEKSFYTRHLGVSTWQQPLGQLNTDNLAANALVKNLSENILNTGSNITMDKSFTPIHLTQQLLTDHRTAIVVTLPKNIKEYPSNLVNTKDRSKPSSVFGFGEKKVLLSHVVPNKRQKE